MHQRTTGTDQTKATTTTTNTEIITEEPTNQQSKRPVPKYPSLDAANKKQVDSRGTSKLSCKLHRLLRIVSCKLQVASWELRHLPGSTSFPSNSPIRMQKQKQKTEKKKSQSNCKLPWALLHLQIGLNYNRSQVIIEDGTKNTGYMNYS